MSAKTVKLAYPKRVRIREPYNPIFSLVLVITSCANAPDMAHAQGVDDSQFGSEMFLECYAAADRLFERALQSNADSKTRMTTISTIAQDELNCAPFSIRVCLNSTRIVECLELLGGAIKSERMALLADLPATIEGEYSFAEHIYESTLIASTSAEPLNDCPAEITLHENGCEVLSEASAFQLARQAYWISKQYSRESE